MPGVRPFRHSCVVSPACAPWPAGVASFMPTLFVACESRSISRPTCESISFSKASVSRSAVRLSRRVVAAQHELPRHVGLPQVPCVVGMYSSPVSRYRPPSVSWYRSVASVSFIGRYPPQLLLSTEGVGAPVVDVQVRLEGHRHLR